MTELRPRGRELLEAARLERTPSTGDRERVLAALFASAALTSTSAVASAAAAPSLLAKLTTGAAKWWLLGSLCTTTAVGVAYVTATPAASVAAPVGVPVPVPGPVPDPPAPQPDSAAVPPPPVAPAPSMTRAVRRETSAPTLEQELSSLHAAHAAYRNGDVARALSLITEHQRQFPRSQLATERSTLQVLTLCRLGRTQQAQALASRLRAAQHGAAALSGLQGSCAAAPQ